MSERVSRLDALVGIVFVAVVVVTIAAFEGPAPTSSASAAKVVSYYDAHTGQTRAAGYLTAVAIVLALYFYNAVRTYLARAEQARSAASLAMSGAVVFGCGAGAVSGVREALADVPSKLSPGTLQGLSVLQNDMSSFFFGAGIGLMLLAFAVAIFRSALMPSWFGWLSIVLGALALVAGFTGASSIFAAVWTLIAAVLLYRRASASSQSPGRSVAPAQTRP